MWMLPVRSAISAQTQPLRSEFGTNGLVLLIWEEGVCKDAFLFCCHFFCDVTYVAGFLLLIKIMEVMMTTS
jgi:hypothetical protein